MGSVQDLNKASKDKKTKHKPGQYKSTLGGGIPAHDESQNMFGGRNVFQSTESQDSFNL